MKRIYFYAETDKRSIYHYTFCTVLNLVLPNFYRYVLPRAVYGYTFINKEIRKEIIFKRFNRLLTQHKGLLR